VPAIPAIISGGAAIGSALIGGKMGQSAANKAMEKTPEEQAAFANNTKLAGQQTGQSNQMFGMAMPAVRNSLNYYQTLLGGNRAARNAAVGSEAESIGSAYEGANQAVDRGYVQGGQRDLAVAENARAKAGAISRLTTGVRPMAAQGAAGIASGLMGNAQRGYGNAAGIYNQQGVTEMANRRFGSEAGTATSGNFGRLFAQILNLTRGGKSSGGGSSTGAEPGWDTGFG
jgi:hypothetical protein